MVSRGFAPIKFLGKTFCWGALLGLSLLCGSSSVSATSDSHILISPVTLSASLDPGQVYQSSFTVKNTGDEVETLYPLARPYSVQGSDYLPSYDIENDSFSQIYKWVTFGQSEYQLDPGAEAQVDFTVTVPDDVPAGGQYAALLLEAKGDSQAMFNASTSVGPLLLAQVNGDTRIDGSHHDQQMSQFVTFGPFVARTSFENNGNVDYIVTTTLAARNFFTGDYDYDNSDAPVQSYIFPGKPRTLGTSWPDQPLIGIYNVTYTVNYLDNDYTLERVVIFCPFWAILLFAGLIAFMVIYAILDHKKRHRF